MSMTADKPVVAEEERYGWWRYDENLVVYPIRDERVWDLPKWKTTHLNRRCTVVDLRTNQSEHWTTDYIERVPGKDSHKKWRAVAEAYFAAHPHAEDAEPWRSAIPGDIWALRHTPFQMRPCKFMADGTWMDVWDSVTVDAEIVEGRLVFPSWQRHHE